MAVALIGEHRLQRSCLTFKLKIFKLVMPRKTPELSIAQNFNYLYPKTDRGDFHSNEVGNRLDSFAVNDFVGYAWFRGELRFSHMEIYRRAEEVNVTVSKCREEIEKRQLEIEDFLNFGIAALDKDKKSNCINYLKKNLSAYWNLIESVGLKVTAFSEARQAAKKEAFLDDEAFKRGCVEIFEKKESGSWFEFCNHHFQFAVKEKFDCERGASIYDEYSRGIMEKLMSQTDINNTCSGGSDESGLIHHIDTEACDINERGDSVVGCDGFIDGELDVYRSPEEESISLIGQNYGPNA